MANSYYSVLFIVDVGVADENLPTSGQEITEFSWMAYDAEQGCATEQACYHIRPEETQLEDSITLAGAIQQLDSVIFAAMQRSRKPMSLAAFNAKRFFTLLNQDAQKQDITLYPHYNHCVDIVQLIKDTFPAIHNADLKTIQKASLQLGVTPVARRGSLEPGLDNCQTLSLILSGLFMNGLVIRKEHSAFVTDAPTPSSPQSKGHSSKGGDGFSSTLQGGVNGEAFIRLRGLPWDVEVHQIVDFLSSICTVSQDDIHIVIGYDGRVTGEAYVVMPSTPLRDAAIKDLHGKLIGRRWVEVFKASEVEFKRNVPKHKGLDSTGGMGEGVLRLRGLPWSCNEYEIVKFFKEGNFNISPEDVVLGYASDNRMSGEAWVIMDSPGKADSARAALHEKSMGRRYIEVFPSTRGDIQQARMIRQGHSSPYQSRNQAMSRTPGDANFGFTIVRLRGLPFHANETHIANFFSGYHMTLIMPTTAPINGKPTGEAYVQFYDADEAWKAYKSKNKQFIENRYIELFPATKQEMEYVAQGGDPRGLYMH